MFIMRALKFDIYDEFGCTGAECEDSCCRDWEIDLTKREYLDYKKMECSPELRSIVNSAFKRIKDGSEYKYARMDLKEDGSCPFLGEDRLCMIQKEKGETALTLVCNSFPRSWCNVGADAAVFTLNPTCCRVVELLMKHPEGLAIVEEEYDGENRWINRNLWSGGILHPADKTYSYIWSIKTAQLDILQNREFTVAERLLILGYYTQKVCGYLESSPEKIEQLGAMMLDHELCRKIADALKTPQTETEAEAKSVDILYKALNTDFEGHIMKLINVIADSLELGYVKNDKGENVIRWNINSYNRNRDFFLKMEEERPYIIENLMALLAFSRFPADATELWENYFSLVVLYNFLKAGMASFLPENCTDTQLAMAVTNIVKIVLNTGFAKKIIMKDFDRSNSNTLPHVAFLIS